MMLHRPHRRRPDAVTAAMLAAVASESRPYTDPRAGYPTALAYRAVRESVAPHQKGTPMATSRNWDRSPETDTDKRFHDLRDSGYTGWIEDGNAVDGPRFVHTTHDGDTDEADAATDEW